MSNTEAGNKQRNKDLLSHDGKTAYDILSEHPELPYHLHLPKANSMTQARMDYEHRRKEIIQWYNTNSKPGEAGIV